MDWGVYKAIASPIVEAASFRTRLSISSRTISQARSAQLLQIIASCPWIIIPTCAAGAPQNEQCSCLLLFSAIGLE